MFFKNKPKKTKNKSESGILVVESAFYLPLLLLAYFGFLVMALYVTQRVVLDSSVSRTALEASAYLSDEAKNGAVSKDGKSANVNRFSEKKESIIIDPYRRLIGVFKPTYGSLGEAAFKSQVQAKVREYAGFTMLLGNAGRNPITVTTKYKNYAFFGELTIDAEQSFILPIRLSMFGYGDSLAFKATSKTMVLKPASLINDVDLVFDVLRFFGADVRKVQDLVSGLPGKIKSLGS